MTIVDRSGYKEPQTTEPPVPQGMQSGEEGCTSLEPYGAFLKVEIDRLRQEWFLSWVQYYEDSGSRELTFPPRVAGEEG